MILDSNMVFSDKLKNHKKIMKQLNKRSVLLNVFVVSLRGDAGTLEIYRAEQFAQSMFPVDELTVIGAFESEDEAIEFIRMLTECSFSKLGEIDYRNAFKLYVKENEQ